MYDLYPGQRATGQLMLDSTNILDPRLDLNLLRARVGMVFQKPTPFPMSIYENIAVRHPRSTRRPPSRRWTPASRKRCAAARSGTR